MYFWAGGQGIGKARRMYFRAGLPPKKRGLRVRCPQPSLCETDSRVDSAECEEGLCVARGSE